MPTRKHQEAFTLVELLVVMVIIAILAAITLGVAGSVGQGGAETQAKAEIAQIQLEIELYQSDEGALPSYTGNALGADFFQWFEDRYGDGNGVIDGEDRIYDTVDMSDYQNPDGTIDTTNMKLIDPWGNEYRYEKTNTFLYLIGSAGPDGRWGGSHSDDDLSSRKGSNL